MNRLYVTGVSLLIILCAWFLVALAAHGQSGPQQPDVHRHPGMSKELDVFYSTWYMPDTRIGGLRTTSCCNRRDCHPAIIQFNKEKKRWEGRYADTTYQREFWLPIPDGKLEENHLDARESPDGQSHMCGNSMHIYCAVRGSGQ